MHELQPAEVAATVLRWIPLFTLLVFGSAQTAPNNYPSFPNGPYWTLVDLAHVGLMVVSMTLAFTKGYLDLHNAEEGICFSTYALREGTSDCAVAISLALLTTIMWRRRRQCLPPSAFAVALLGLLSTAYALVSFNQFIMLTSLENITVSLTGLQRESIIVGFLVTTAVVGNFFLSEVQDLVIKSSPGLPEQKDDDSSSVIGRQIGTVLFPLLKQMVHNGASASARLPILRRGMRCTSLMQAFAIRLKAKRIIPGHSGDFMLALLRVLWVDALRMGMAVAAYYGCIFARIPALELLINSSSSAETASAALLFAATTTCEFLLSCYQMDLLNVFGCRARSMLQSLIFRKVTTMPPQIKACYPAGRIASLLSVDCSLVSSCSFCIPVPLLGTILLPLLFWMLGTRAGPGPALCCAAWTFMVICLPFVGSFIQKRMWMKAMRAREERLKTMADLLSTIRVVKMYAWEEALQDSVLSSRYIELKWLLRVNLLDGILDCIYSSTSSVLMIVLFSTLSVFQPEFTMTPGLSFSCVSLLYLTDITMNTIGPAFRIFSQALLALKRIATFCTTEERREWKSETSAAPSMKPGAVVMRQCSVSWPQPDNTNAAPHLMDIDLAIKPGSLVGVVGSTGSGKSSLLAAMLGEMHLIKGDIRCTGRVAFSPQLPTVYNMTIRDNILFGKPMDTTFYHRVIQCCQLMSDINKLSSRDLTEVGEKGSNLSGGQKQRISIARAVYSRSDVYLLDDPLSGLDAIVARRLFKAIIGKDGLLKDKTRIMVCNQGHYLHHMDKVLFVDGKCVKVYNKLEDLIQDQDSPRHFHEALYRRSSHGLGNAESSLEKLDANNTIGRLTHHELGESKRVSSPKRATPIHAAHSSRDYVYLPTTTAWQLMSTLLRLCGWPAPAGVLAFLASACAFALQQLWIKRWTDETTRREEAASVHAPQQPWVSVLVGLCMMDVTFRIVGSVLLALSAYGISRSLHNDMLRHVLKSPVSFFQESPRGRILNRFSTDMEYVDARCFLGGKQTVQNTLVTLAKVVVVGVESHLIVAITLVIAAGIGYAMRVLLWDKSKNTEQTAKMWQNLVIKAAHSARYFESLAMSRLLQLAAETVDTLSSVRTYGVVDRLRRLFCHLADDTMRGYMCFCTTYRFMRMLTATSGFLVVICTLLANTVFTQPEGPDPSSLGLTLSAASSVPLSLMSLCVTLFALLQMGVSFERCVEYAELPPEADTPVAGIQTSSFAKYLLNWPSEGKVQFENYCASYRPGVLPNVLNDITFTIRPAEKVGVVGRTGAGKSSIVLALLRMLKPSEGLILVDGIDISTVSLHKLRSSITVIPQDPCLVKGTLRMNLDPTNSHSDEEIWRALERAHLLKVVSGYGRGLLLETADGGTNFSVGQRQLVCLARALLRGSKVVLLDEATSQMDGDTDHLIQATLKEAFADCTLLTVAHRIHTVLDYDRILVMDDGRVQEFDTVSKLLSDTSSVFHKMAVECGIHAAEKGDELTTASL